jgi:hypothetical protein
MAGVFRSKVRLKAGGTMNPATGVMTGGVTLGHFMVSVRTNVDRPVLTRQISNGPTTQETDPDGDTCTIEIEASQDTVRTRNLQRYAAAGGYVEVVSNDAADQEVIERYIPFMFGGMSTSGGKEAATESTTLVGTNKVREAEWVAAQSDMPAEGGGA